MMGCSVYDTRASYTNRSVQTVAPTLEPLTLDEAKLRAGLDWPSGDPRDGQMQLFIEAARQRVERDTGVALLTQTWEVYLSHATSVVDFPAPAQPLQTLAVIREPASLPPPPVTDVNDPLQLYPWAYEIVVGWTAVEQIPPLLRWAVGLLTAHYATAARDAVVVGTIASEVPLGYDDALLDFRRVGP